MTPTHPGCDRVGPNVYDMKTKTITLTGNVVVSQGKNVLHGERVVVDTVTGDARIDSGVTPRDRVRVLIVPGKDTKGAPTNTMSFEAPSHPQSFEAPSHPH